MSQRLATRRAATSTSAQGPKGAEQCPLCANDIHGRKTTTLKDSDFLGDYNILLSHVNPSELLPNDHESSLVWAYARKTHNEQVKSLSLGEVVCSNCHNPDKITIKSWNGKKSGTVFCESQPRYWKQGRLKEYRKVTKEAAKCLVCVGSQAARSALAGAEDSSANDCRAARAAQYSSSNYGSDMMSFFFYALYGDKIPFSGASGPDICSAHYQHFLTKPPMAYLQQLEAKEGQRWVGWRERRCVACGFDSKERNASDDKWLMAAGLSSQDRIALEEKLQEDHLLTHELLQIGGGPSAAEDLSRIAWICSVCWSQHGFCPPEYPGVMLTSEMAANMAANPNTNTASRGGNDASPPWIGSLQLPESDKQWPSDGRAVYQHLFLHEPLDNDEHCSSGNSEHSPTTARLCKQSTSGY